MLMAGLGDGRALRGFVVNIEVCQNDLGNGMDMENIEVLRDEAIGCVGVGYCSIPQRLCVREWCSENISEGVTKVLLVSCIRGELRGGLKERVCGAADGRSIIVQARNGNIKETFRLPNQSSWVREL